MPLKGLAKKGGTDNPFQRSPFRSSFFQPEGLVGAYLIECVVINVHLRNYTVDCISKYDQRRFLNVQVSSPYMHYQRGEGLSITPDIGAKCHVCVPSDGPPPFVSNFVMPMETLEDAEEGASGGSGEEGTTAATFAGGRKRAKLGDISLTGRDGQFLILHRGGVLQIGATQLSQRIYIPLQNLMMDISQNYRHYNTGGSINWFLNRSVDEDNPPTIHHQTYRLLANDAKASLRVAVGKLSDVIRENDDTISSNLQQLGIGIDEPIVCEVLLSVDGFVAEDGSTTPDTRRNTKLRYFFDKGGNTLLRTEGSVYLHIKKKLRVVVEEDVAITSKGGLQATFAGPGRLQVDGGLDITSPLIRINGGKNDVATVGSVVEVTIMPGMIPIFGASATGGPVTGFIGTPIGGPIPTLKGVVTTGYPLLKV